MSSPYSPEAQRCYEEAIRTVPGLIVAKERKAPKDAAVLLEGYMEVTKREGLTNQQAWSVLFNASIHWSHQLVKGIASRENKEPTEVAADMGALAAAWTG